jgi:hypothetical protein
VPALMIGKPPTDCVSKQHFACGASGHHLDNCPGGCARCCNIDDVSYGLDADGCDCCSNSLAHDVYDNGAADAMLARLCR